MSRPLVFLKSEREDSPAVARLESNERWQANARKETTLSDQENPKQDEEQEDVEAHKTSVMRPTTAEPDVEGHKLAEGEDEGDDDVEAHRSNVNRPSLP
jgi:hypothetical protein